MNSIFHRPASGQPMRSATTGCVAHGRSVRHRSINFAQNYGHLLLEAVIAAADLPQNIAGKPLQLGLTAVIESERWQPLLLGITPP